MANPSISSPPSLPLKTRINIFVMSIFFKIFYRRDDTINRPLLNFVSKFMDTSPNPKPINGVKSYDVTVDITRDLWFRVYVPTDATADSRLPVIVFYHGGGFIFFSARSKYNDDLCRRFCGEVRAVVVSVNYRNAPEHRYPAQYVDGFDVIKFLDDGNNQVLPENADLSRFFLSGDSAGGNIAHHVAIKACSSKFEKLKIMGLVGIQPFYGGEERVESEKREASPVTVKNTDQYWRAFLPPGGKYNRDHEVVNVSGPHAVDISSLNFPATLVLTGGADVLHDWNVRYYEWLKRSGKEAYFVNYPNMFHGFYLSPELPQSSQVISEIREFITKSN